MNIFNSVSTGIARQRVTVEGIVQGVGFRPFVYSLASSLGLGGFVLNESNGVVIEVEGTPARLEAFETGLRDAPPPLARIDRINVEAVTPQNASGFTIAVSRTAAARNTLIAPDAATCDNCLRELLDPADRRYRYPFTNCTNCGPRFTIVEDIPYDRDKTTMQLFTMCPTCRREYENPLDRRFHAQPNACPLCGPHVTLSCLEGRPFQNDAAVRETARLLAAGRILAIKGLGGYHLACDGLNSTAVGRLRGGKRRDAKPFALMVPNLETAHSICRLNEAEATLLHSRRRPIVLLSRRPDCPVPPEVAPHYGTLGLMLPYTPLHHLLLHYFNGLTGSERPAVLVMTSGNGSSEPIAYQDDDALARLAPPAEGWLTHNRAIHVRCDDSVSRIIAGSEQIFRRSRGYAPEPVRLARAFPLPLLACGGHLKNTFCLGKGDQAFVSQHIGDLENVETLLSFREAIAHFQQLFDIHPAIVAYDLHPDYLATKYALELPVPHKIGVQHHHAHIASVLAEHGLEGPVIGVAADGTGYGSDGAVWGGEILLANLVRYERVAHLAYAPLPGGERAVRQPWRMAAAWLQQTFAQSDGEDDFLNLDIPFVAQLDRPRWHVVRQMIDRGLNTPATSSMGRLFDAVAALLGGRYEVAYEGQAAIELEMMAVPDGESYPFTFHERAPAGDGMWQMDPAPALRAITGDLQAGVAPATIAGRFHETMARMLATAVQRAREQSGLKQVALSGGVFQNRLLLERLLQLLQEDGFETYINHQVPPNDGGLSLGQAAVAAALVRSGALQPYD